MIRWLLPCILALAFWVPASSSAASFPDRYDDQIRSAVKRYWPDYPFWLSWKAQLYQESRLRPDAVSPVGARGLAQFMPATWGDIAPQIGAGTASPHETRWAIPAGAYYMAKLRRSWSSPRPEDDRHRLAQASYNAGLGNILKAQRRCGGARHYPDIIPCLESVTGARNSHETRTYVDRIARWRAMMEARL